MAQHITIARRLKRLGSSAINLPLFCLAAVVSISVELFAWGGVFSANQATVSVAGTVIRLAWAEAAMSSAFSLAALSLAAAAASMKSDPRPQQKRRAGAAQALAVFVLIAPVFYAAQCSAMNTQNQERLAYVGSAQYQADLRDANDRTGMTDSQARRDAADRLGLAQAVTRADLPHLIPAFLWISLILGSNMLAVRLGWRARPETPSEAKARLKAQSVAKAKHTREMNKRLANDATNVTKFRRA